MTTPSDLYGRPWQENEYIVALHYYVKYRSDGFNEKSIHVKDLAALLGRTIGSVLMRLENYASLDPDIARKGLSNVGPIGERIFSEWCRKADALASCAEVLIRAARERSQPTLFDPSPVRIPHAFGKYELLDLVGEGACGSVYSCINTVDKKRYALKIIRTDKIADPETLARFRREIRLLKSQTSLGVIRIFEDNLDSIDRFPGFIMEYATTSLRSYVEQKTKDQSSGMHRPLLPPSETTSILKEVFDAVSALHGSKPSLLHRDINPNNILRVDGRWVVSDFSLGKLMQPAPVTTAFATQTYQGWGTEPYAAPEQWRDFKRVDQRADLYALGVLIWELMSPSWPPFDRTELALPTKLANLVLRATHRKKEERPADISELINGFDEALADIK